MKIESSPVAWAAGSVHRVTAEVAKQAIDQVAAESGLQADTKAFQDALVEKARDPQHPLHVEFEWNNSVAADIYRRHQAAALVRHLVYCQVGARKEPLRSYQVVRTQPDHAGQSAKVYRSLEDSLRDPYLRQQLVDQALMELMRVRQKYRALSELSTIFEAIEAFEAVA